MYKYVFKDSHAWMTFITQKEHFVLKNLVK